MIDDKNKLDETKTLPCCDKGTTLLCRSSKGTTSYKQFMAAKRYVRKDKIYMRIVWICFIVYFLVMFLWYQSIWK